MLNTRFGKAGEFMGEIKKITGEDGIKTLLTIITFSIIIISLLTQSQECIISSYLRLFQCLFFQNNLKI